MLKFPAYSGTRACTVPTYCTLAIDHRGLRIRARVGPIGIRIDVYSPPGVGARDALTL